MLIAYGLQPEDKYDKHGKPKQDTCIRGADGYYVGGDNMNAVWMLKGTDNIYLLLGILLLTFYILTIFQPYINELNF